MRFRWRLISHFPALWPVHDLFNTADFSIFSDGIKSCNRPSTIHSQYKFLKDRCCCLWAYLNFVLPLLGCADISAGSDFSVIFTLCCILEHHWGIAMSAVIYWIYLPLKEKAWLVFTLLFSFNMWTLGPNPQFLRARAVMVLKARLCFSSTPHAAALGVSSTNAPRGKVIDLPLDVALRLLTVCKCRGLSSLHHWGKAAWNSLLDVA